MPTNFGWNMYMSCVLCSKAERRWEWGDVKVGGQVTEVFSFSAELLLACSGSGGDFFFLDREREGRVGETCLL